MTEQQRLLLNGSASLDCPNDDQVPRGKGLIELLNQYSGNIPNCNLTLSKIFQHKF